MNPNPDNRKPGLAIAFPRGVIMARADPVLDRYIELRAKFKDLDEDRYLKLAGEAKKTAGTPGWEFIQYVILDRIVAWRQGLEAGIADQRRADKEAGKIEALTHFAWNLAANVIEKAEEIEKRRRQEEARRRQKNVTSDPKKKKGRFSVGEED